MWYCETGESVSNEYVTACVGFCSRDRNFVHAARIEAIGQHPVAMTRDGRYSLNTGSRNTVIWGCKLCNFFALRF